MMFVSKFVSLIVMHCMVVLLCRSEMILIFSSQVLLCTACMEESHMDHKVASYM